VRCTRPLHAAQVIPVTGIVQDSLGDVSVSDIGYPCFSAMMVPRTMPMPHANS